MLSSYLISKVQNLKDTLLSSGVYAEQQDNTRQDYLDNLEHLAPKIEVAKNMLANGLDIKQVARCSGFSLETVRRLNEAD